VPEMRREDEALGEAPSARSPRAAPSMHIIQAQAGEVLRRSQEGGLDQTAFTAQIKDWEEQWTKLTVGRRAPQQRAQRRRPGDGRAGSRIARGRNR
jgi:hypothetical protein